MGLVVKQIVKDVRQLTIKLEYIELTLRLSNSLKKKGSNLTPLLPLPVNSRGQSKHVICLGLYSMTHLKKFVN